MKQKFKNMSTMGKFMVLILGGGLIYVAIDGVCYFVAKKRNTIKKWGIFKHTGANVLNDAANGAVK